MEKNKTNLMLVVLSVVAACDMVTYHLVQLFADRNYVLYPVILQEILFPVIVGVLLYYVCRSEVTKVMCGVYIVVNALLAIVLSCIYVGSVSKYNIIIMAVLAVHAMQKKF